MTSLSQRVPAIIATHTVGVRDCLMQPRAISFSRRLSHAVRDGLMQPRAISFSRRLSHAAGGLFHLAGGCLMQSGTASCSLRLLSRGLSDWGRAKKRQFSVRFHAILRMSYSVSYYAQCRISFSRSRSYLDCFNVFENKGGNSGVLNMTTFLSVVIANTHCILDPGGKNDPDRLSCLFKRFRSFAKSRT
jgi:hypothetical protein